MDQDIASLRRMIEEIRQIRERTCDPKSNHNPRYHALSSAVSSLGKAAKDMSARPQVTIAAECASPSM